MVAENMIVQQESSAFCCHIRGRGRDARHLGEAIHKNDNGVIGDGACGSGELGDEVHAHTGPAIARDRERVQDPERFVIERLVPLAGSAGLHILLDFGIHLGPPIEGSDCLLGLFDTRVTAHWEVVHLIEDARSQTECVRDHHLVVHCPPEAVAQSEVCGLHLFVRCFVEPFVPSVSLLHLGEEVDILCWGSRCPVGRCRRRSRFLLVCSSFALGWPGFCLLDFATLGWSERAGLRASDYEGFEGGDCESAVLWEPGERIRNVGAARSVCPFELKLLQVLRPSSLLSSEVGLGL